MPPRLTVLPSIEREPVHNLIISAKRAAHLLIAQPRTLLHCAHLTLIWVVRRAYLLDYRPPP